MAERWRQFPTKIDDAKLTPMPNRNAVMLSKSVDCDSHSELLGDSGLIFLISILHRVS